MKRIFILLFILALGIIPGCLEDGDNEDGSNDTNDPVTYYDRIYTLGGYNDSKGTLWNDLWQYRTEGNRWYYAFPGTDKISKYAAVLRNDYIYVFCGERDTDSWTNKVWRYNTRSGSIAELSTTNGPHARGELTAVAYDDKVYVFGGYYKTGGVSKYDRDVYIYDRSSDTWVRKSAGGTWPDGRRSHSAVVYEGKMYVFGGYQETTRYDELWVYDFSSDTWEQKTSYTNYERYGHGAVVYNDKMYVFGGIDKNGDYKDTLLIYKFNDNSWSNKSLPISGRAYSGVTIDTNGNMFIVGGYDGSNYLKSLIKHDIDADQTNSKNSPPDDRAYIQALYHDR